MPEASLFPEIGERTNAFCESMDELFARWHEAFRSTAQQRPDFFAARVQLHHKPAFTAHTYPSDVEIQQWIVADMNIFMGLNYGELSMPDSMVAAGFWEHPKSKRMIDGVLERIKSKRVDMGIIKGTAKDIGGIQNSVVRNIREGTSSWQADVYTLLEKNTDSIVRIMQFRMQRSLESGVEIAQCVACIGREVVQMIDEVVGIKKAAAEKGQPPVRLASDQFWNAQFRNLALQIIRAVAIAINPRGPDDDGGGRRLPFRIAG